MVFPFVWLSTLFVIENCYSYKIIKFLLSHVDLSIQSILNGTSLLFQLSKFCCEVFGSEICTEKCAKCHLKYAML